MSREIPVTSGEPRYRVVWPLGRSTTELVAANAGLADLNGKTIGFIWDYVFRGDEMFPVIAEALRQRYPDVRFVDYPAFGNIHGSDERAVIEALPARLRQAQVDGVVVGVGA